MWRQLTLPLVEEPPDRLTGVRVRFPDPRARLEYLLAGDLNFIGAETGYATHHLHSFAARFPPQLPRHFIQALTLPGEIVLDPMVGSGTTVVEAGLLRRKGIGVDLDPLAIRIGKAKITPIDAGVLADAEKRVLTRAHRLLKDVPDPKDVLAPDPATWDFVQYWFLPQTQRELTALVRAIGEEKEPTVRQFLLIVLSSIIVTKSGGVSLACDLAHSRPHREANKPISDALEMFQTRLRRLRSHISLPEGQAVILHGDARSLPLPDNSVHLVVTSPPYANAIDYMRAHKFSLVWMGKSIRELTDWRARHIGSERACPTEEKNFPPFVQDVVEELTRRDSRRASILAKYFAEMRKVLQETYRVLRPSAAAVLVVGTSVVRGLNVQTHLCLADIAADIGFDLAGIAERQLDRDRRMMPTRRDQVQTSIEQRMHHEYVIGLMKSED